MAETVGVALHVVLDGCLPPSGWPSSCTTPSGSTSPTVAAVLDLSPDAARACTSRARAKVATLVADSPAADWKVVDAFLAAARGGDFARLLHLLAPDVVVTADPEAIATGTPQRLESRTAVAEMFAGRPGRAARHGRGPAGGCVVPSGQGQAWVAFDFQVEAGQVVGIVFRAAPPVLAGLVRRSGRDPRTDLG